MLDRTIPFFNTIMKCSDYKHRDPELPDGFSIISYQPGHEKEWAKLEVSIGDFCSSAEAEDYFIKTYLHDPNQSSNILFALNSNHEVVGFCMAWQDTRGVNSVSSLHWLVVHERYQGIGLGKALCISVMNIFEKRRGFPVYIHTQPWSWKAILLYLSLGFKLQTTDSFSHYQNEYENAMSELKKIVSEEQYELLRQSSED